MIVFTLYNKDKEIVSIEMRGVNVEDGDLVSLENEFSLIQNYMTEYLERNPEGAEFGLKITGMKVYPECHICNDRNETVRKMNQYYLCEDCIENL